MQALVRNPLCPVGLTVEMVGGKWKGIILYFLLDGTLRFSELRRKIPGITQRMLTLQLRELESDGLVERTVYAVVPPRVEYALSPWGRSLEPVLRAMRDWGTHNKDRIEGLIADRETLSA
ncbi:MAG: transcriptional regulator [Candidatus Eremiobacteraeota bacterium]|nr:transcriptional regulator [Candidatus Eremiobacteraeota bacterium]